MAQGGDLRKPIPDGQGTVDYPEVRNTYVSFYDQENYVEWLVKAGEYVRCCWHAEAALLDGAPLTVKDEERTSGLWDAYSRDDLDQQQETALNHLEVYVQKRVKQDRWRRSPRRFILTVGEWALSAVVGTATLGFLAFMVVNWLPSAALWAKKELDDASRMLAVAEAEDTRASTASNGGTSQIVLPKPE